MTQTNLNDIPIPDLNREGVTNRTIGVPYFDFDAYGTFELALKHFRFEPGNKKNPHFRADCVIQSSNNEAWPVGRECAIHFPTQRPGTATDPARPDRDDAYVADFIRSVFKIPKGQKYDNTAAMRALLSKGKLPDTSVRFVFIRSKGNTQKKFDNKTQQLVEITYPKDVFAPVAT
jgi:hypothetical protein